MAVTEASSLDLMLRPFAFGDTTLRNRVAMAPMTRNHSPAGVPGEDVALYYRRRAAGGAGLIITEGTYVDHPAANGYADVPAFFGAGLEGWRRVVATVHEEGAAIVPQLWHVGAVRRAGTEPNQAVPGVGPSAVIEDGRTVVEALDPSGIAAVVDAYARAARDAAAIGCDGVEVHGAHGYLLDQFLWAGANGRTDRYGGTIANRVRFAVEVVTAIRAAVPRRFPIIFRFSQWKMSDYTARIASDRDELAAILLPLREAGVDIFHASTRRFWEPAFGETGPSLAAETRALTGCPVIAVGSAGLEQPHQTRKLRTAENVRSAIGNIDQVAEGFRNDDFDIIAVGRAMLADAAWTRKVAQGKAAALNRLSEDVLERLI